MEESVLLCEIEDKDGKLKKSETEGNFLFEKSQFLKIEFLTNRFQNMTIFLL